MFSLIGLSLGLLFDGLVYSHTIYAFYYLLLGLVALLYALAYNEKDHRRLVGSSVVVALFLSLPLLGLKIKSLSGTTFLSAFPVFVYAVHAFHFAYHRDNSWRVSYKSLFAAVWNTIFLLLVAILFLLIAKLLIILGAIVFSTIGSNFLENVSSKNIHFIFIFNTTIFFIGLGVGQENIKIIYSLRLVLLKMMYYLFPCLALITVSYSILYMVYFLGGKLQIAISLKILILLSSLGIIFFNAYFQDGYSKSNTYRWLELFLRSYRVVLFL